MKIKHALLAALCGFSTVTSAFAADATTNSVNPEADRLLRSVCAHLAAAKAFSFKAEVWEDTVVEGHKVSTAKTVITEVRRPDRVQMEVRSPKRSRGFWYDGKSVTLLDRKANLYGAVAALATIDQTLDAANDQYGINFPLEDFLVNDPYASAMAAVNDGAYFGKVDLLGTPCQHVAFSTDQVDFQLWIQDGPKPLPRKYVITYKQQDAQPQFTAIFSDWNLKRSLPDKTFVFSAPKGAGKINILPAADKE
jgi:hypothetical protein